MARIRSIKIELWTNERLSELPEPTHMLAAALINYCDDEGYFNANPALIRAACFPLRELSVAIDKSLQLLEGIDFARFFQGTDGRRYGQIVGFATHQRVNRPTPSRIKDLATKTEPEITTSAQTHGGLTEDSAPERKGTEGNGYRKRNGRTVPVHCMSDHSAFADLTVDDLRDSLKLLAWYQSQAERPRPIISQSDQSRHFVFCAAEQALSAKDVQSPVGLHHEADRAPSHPARPPRPPPAVAPQNIPI